MPFQKDFVMRQIGQLAQALASALVSRKLRQYEEALREIDGAVSANTEVDVQRLLQMSDAELAEFLAPNGHFNSDYASVVARLLNERAEVAGLKGDKAQESKSYRTTLSILKLIRDSGSDAIPFDLYQQISSLESMIEDAE